MKMVMHRRHFLSSASLALAALSLPDLPVLAAQAAQEETGIGAWIRIAHDGAITIFQPQSEMGQGVDTSMPMLIAEELEVDFAKVKVAAPLASPEFANQVYGFQTTAESTSMRAFFDKCRTVGAQAREMLKAAAAQRLNVDASGLVAADGRITDPLSGRSLSYAELAPVAATLTPPAAPALKAKSEWKLIGTPRNRTDSIAKSTGRAGYGVDIRLPGLLTAAVMQCPTPGGRLVSVDEAPALAVKGVRKVVKVDTLVAVLADGYWQATKGLKALSPVWDMRAGAGFSTEAAFAQFRAALDSKPGAPAETIGDPDAVFATAAKVVKAEYVTAYLAHVTMEPQNATAHYTPEKLTVWAPTQGQGLVGLVIGPLVGLKPEQVECHTTFLGGGFGRRFELDVPIQAALLSKAAGAPVKVIWSREEDIMHDFYRPGAVARFEAAVDAKGKIVGLRTAVATSSILSRAVPSLVKDGVDITGVDGIKGSDYDWGARSLRYHMENTAIPVGFWRSVAHSGNAWLIEGFLNEIAAVLGKDPVALRREMLAGKPRNLAVLDKLAAVSRWGEQSEGRFKGIALHHSFDSVIGHVFEISMPDKGAIKIEKITTVADVGTVVNPAILTAQLQSAVVDGLSSALTGEITYKDGQSVQTNFDTYDRLRLRDMPVIEVHLLELGGKIGGGGEPGVPAVAPALVAAVNAAMGTTVRSLPLSRHNISLA